MKMFVWICALGLLAITQLSVAKSNKCAQLEQAFLNVSDNDEPACRCMPSEFGRDESDEEFIFIGCTKQTMPNVYRALHAVNETNITQLIIWDSMFIAPSSSMFSMVRPKILSIQRSDLSYFHSEPFADLGDRLKNLFLRNNILRKIDKQTFAKLSNLELLDLSGNKLEIVKRETLSHLKSLEILLVSNNRINAIEDGAFDGLSNLRTLNLAHNELRNITRDTLRGLSNLETLELEGNLIDYIDENAFKHTPKLRLLNLGNNTLKRITLRNMSQLTSLLLNNNTIRNLKHVVFSNLPSLLNLRLDKNHITRIQNGDLEGLRESRQLRSLSLVANNLSFVAENAFRPCSQLTILSLQNNDLKSLRSETEDGKEGVSWLKPMTKLKSIYLSRNNISSLQSGDLNVIPTLQEVSMDNNQLTSIDKDALKGLQLKKLFLNNNRFYYLPEGIFEGWNTEVIYSVDLAENPWECICGHEWIGEWLSKLGDRSTPSGNVGCVAYQQRRCDLTDEPPKHSAWITVIAGVLAFIALLFLTAIAYLYIQEACTRSSVPLRRIPSDMMRLIPSVESLSFPNPVIEDARKEAANSKTAADEVKVANGSPVGADDEQKGEKKRVRFDGI
ncbi:hypothetical protein M3Y99_01352500 [Aphelenchoides fujianensis]|nr:hypothetical protein M3Y99_01352500 [Aphelenchoides fujianensis]